VQGEFLMRRLAFVRYLHQTAVDQSHQPGMLASAAILTLHDAVELFLDLACEHRNVQRRGDQFMGYWDDLGPELLPDGLPMKESLRRVNKLRVNLKHHGTFPSPDVDYARSTVLVFFTETCQAIFGVEFDAVSMTDLAQSERAGASLESANASIRAGDPVQALGKVAAAHAQIVDDYEAATRSRWGRSPFAFCGSMNFLNSFHRGLGRSGQISDMSRFVDTVGDSVTKLQAAMRVVAMGLDYHQFARFQALTSRVRETADGTYVPTTDALEAPPTLEEARFCLDFVVQGPLRFQAVSTTARL